MKADLAVISAILALTERRLEQEAAERQRLADFFQFAPEAYLITRADGSITEANLAAAELLGAPLLGKPLAVFISLDRRAEFRARLGDLSEGKGPLRWQSVLLPRAGAERAAQLHVRGIGDPAVAGLCWVLQPA